MARYKIRFASSYLRKQKKLIKKDRRLALLILDKLDLLARNPFDESLRTNKVGTRRFGKRWSSRVNADIRIIWDTVDGEFIILMLDIGGHSGNRKVYN